MLTIAGSPSRYCDGISRRGWLRIGGLALGGLALPDILRAQAANGAGKAADGRKPAKGIIMVLLPGGPTHLDTFDLKPDAPPEIRGEFRPIATKVPGIDICELMPRLAGMADKLAIIRSLVGFRDDHNTHWCSTGWESHPAMPSSPMIAGFPPGDWPSLGSVLSKRFGPRVAGVPPCVDLTPIDPDARFILRTPPGQPGYLGVAHAGFEVAAVDRGNITPGNVGLSRLADRRALLASFDRFRRRVDVPGFTDGMDEFHRQAFAVLTSPRLAEALDLSREDDRIRSRYGLDRAFPDERQGKTLLDQFLLARRVIEAGARCVTLAFSRWPFGRMLQGDYNWDWHKNLFAEARGALPLFDLGLSALIRDLDERGLLGRSADRRVGRVRPHAEDQQERRPRPLAEGVQRPRRRRRPALRPGHRLHHALGRRAAGPPRPLPRSLRHALRAAGHRRGDDAIHRSCRAAAVSRRRSSAAGRISRLIFDRPDLESALIC